MGEVNGIVMSRSYPYSRHEEQQGVAFFASCMGGPVPSELSLRVATILLIVEQKNVKNLRSRLLRLLSEQKSLVKSTNRMITSINEHRCRSEAALTQQIRHMEEMFDEERREFQSEIAALESASTGNHSHSDADNKSVG